MHSRDLRFLGMLILLVLVSSSAPAGAQPSDETPAHSDVSSYAYYSVRPDSRRCPAPLCGGVFVKLVNQTLTPCVDGSYQHECYTAEVDDTALPLSDAELAELLEAVEAGNVLFQGQIEPYTYPDLGNFGHFVVSEAWLAAGANPATGMYYRVTDNGIRCLTQPCPSFDEAKLNSSLWRRITHVDLKPAGATVKQIKEAYDAMTDPDGVIVAGAHTTVIGLTGKARVLVGSQFYRRLLPSPCQPTGCAGQVCAEMAVPTTCEWRPEYECYPTAMCELQVDGKCGWTETPELLQCLANATGNP